MNCIINRLQRTAQTLVWPSVAVVLIIISGCLSSIPSGSVQRISWQGLNEEQTVYGIVKLAVKITDNTVREVKFYRDGLGEENLICSAILDNGSVYFGDWFTQDAINGTHMVYAVATFRENDASSVSITVNIMNRSRAESIPANIIKMTPVNDKAPPQLSPAFKNIWHDPVPLDGLINTAGAEDSPFITPDGDIFYFWFNGNEMKDAQEQARDPMTGIYWSKKVEGNWQEPQRLFLQHFDKIGFDGAETVRNNTLWFASIREGNYRDMDFWIAELVNGRWTHWANAGELLNRIYQIGELHITADGNEIYFDSDRSGGSGLKDIWVTHRVNGVWQEPQNAVSVNTDVDEGWPFISEDGTQLWFTRLTPGPTIYRSLKVNGEWRTPELIVSSFAGEPTLDETGNLYFVHHRWDDALNRVTESDIYVCYWK